MLLNIPNHKKIDALLEFERHSLMKKITLYVGDKIKSLTDRHLGGYMKGSEITKVYGIPANRQTEWKNYAKYRKVLSAQDVDKMVGSGFLTIKELIENCATTKKEKRFLRDWANGKEG